MTDVYNYGHRTHTNALIDCKRGRLEIDEHGCRINKDVVNEIIADAEKAHEAVGVFDLVFPLISFEQDGKTCWAEDTEPKSLKDFVSEWHPLADHKKRGKPSPEMYEELDQLFRKIANLPLLVSDTRMLDFYKALNNAPLVSMTDSAGGPIGRLFVGEGERIQFLPCVYVTDQVFDELNV